MSETYWEVYRSCAEGRSRFLQVFVTSLIVVVFVVVDVIVVAVDVIVVVFVVVIVVAVDVIVVAVDVIVVVFVVVDVIVVVVVVVVVGILVFNPEIRVWIEGIWGTRFIRVDLCLGYSRGSERRIETNT